MGDHHEFSGDKDAGRVTDGPTGSERAWLIQRKMSAYTRRAQASDMRRGLQRRASGAAAATADPGEAAREASRREGGPGRRLPHLATIQRAFGGHELGGIRAFVGGAHGEAARAMGAEAYATGDEVAFERAPSLHTAAHEAAHVVQQRAGVQLLGGVGREGDTYERSADAVADRVVAGRSAADLLPTSGGPATTPGVQMRRLPGNTGALLSNPDDGSRPGANAAAHGAGARRLIELAEAELSPDERARVETEMLAGQTRAAFDALPEHQRLGRHVEAIRAVRPDLALGDPALIDTGPRRGTADRANLGRLIAATRRIYRPIIGGRRDADLEQVFGAAHVGAARTRYRQGLAWMQRLHRANRIVTDRSGYNDEVGLGGLTGFQEQISVMADAIDRPDEHESIIAMLHESMHAGNSDVSDRGYIGTPVFTQLPAETKLVNAAHYEVVPRRMLGAEYAYEGQTFTPAGAAPTGGGPASAALTEMQTAVRAASEELRRAWTVSLNLHSFYVDAHLRPDRWSYGHYGGNYRDGLPYWSKVQKLTIHAKTDIDPAASDPARRPVSQIDVALSEGITRKLDQCRSASEALPADDAEAAVILRSVAAADEIAAATGDADRMHTLWLRAIDRRVGAVTGGEDRDLRVFRVMSDAYDAWGQVLMARNPDDFAD